MIHGCWVCKLFNTKLKSNCNKSLDVTKSKLFKNKIRNDSVILIHQHYLITWNITEKLQQEKAKSNKANK